MRLPPKVAISLLFPLYLVAIPRERHSEKPSEISKKQQNSGETYA
jgi:hypothetical protein